MRSVRTISAVMPALALTGLLMGCATTRIDAEWRDPAFAGRSFKGNRVLVACQAADDTLRRVCEDQWANQLGLRGVPAVRSYSVAGFPAGMQASPDGMMNAARGSGAAALATTQLGVGSVAVNPGPQVGIGVGGGSGGGYRGGGFSVGGVGLSFPIGGATAQPGLAASTSLVDVASGKIVWSGSASAPASADMAAQVAALTQTTIDALQKAGLL